MIQPFALSNIVVILGGGDLGSGVAIRLFRAGIRVIITELPQPLVVRRTVAFADAVYKGKTTVENVTAKLALQLPDISKILASNAIPIIVDPQMDFFKAIFPLAIVDARMRKKAPGFDKSAAPLVIGLGPGFQPGNNCHAAVETNRGHNLGRVLRKTNPEVDTGIPGSVNFQGKMYGKERILRAPTDGVFRSYVDIGEQVQMGEKIGEMEEVEILAPFAGMVRGLIHIGVNVTRGMKIGDIDPRNNPAACYLVSDKALAVGGGVLEALLGVPDIRNKLWN